MSTGNPKKFELSEQLSAAEGTKKEVQTPTDEVTRVYKDKNHNIKKELAFQTKANKPKLT